MQFGGERVGEKVLPCLFLICFQSSIENKVEVGGRGGCRRNLGHCLSLGDLGVVVGTRRKGVCRGDVFRVSTVLLLLVLVIVAT